MNADLPEKLSMKYETVLNMTTAKALGLDVPTSILLSADEPSFWRWSSSSAAATENQQSK